MSSVAEWRRRWWITMMAPILSPTPPWSQGPTLCGCVSRPYTLRYCTVFDNDDNRDNQDLVIILCLLNDPGNRFTLQGSPFVLNVRRQVRWHRGTFHCCSFCSSGGSKEARCGCMGTMPGRYSRLQGTWLRMSSRDSMPSMCSRLKATKGPVR